MVKVGTGQFACSWDKEANVRRAEHLVRQAADSGVQIFLLQELFETPYFCQDQLDKHFALAHDAGNSPLIKHFQLLAAELSIVLPLSFFERRGNAYFNSLVVIDADGSLSEVYRKSHIPDGVGYQEKFYFNPGDTGFRVFQTKYARIGVGICWDQWFPEAARCMVLRGAQLLFYPSAIGSEPQDPSLDSRSHWTRVMQGHAGANLVPLVACNRIGTETSQAAPEKQFITFYGSSFIAGPTGELLASASADTEEIISAEFDLAAIDRMRASWGMFRDRRPELYGAILTLDGHRQHPGCAR